MCELVFSWSEVTAVATVALAFGVPATLLFDWTERKKEMRQERYVKYATRYQEIFSNLPYNIFTERCTIEDLDERQKAWLIAYIDLCNEELTDFNNKMIDKPVWIDWGCFIISVFRRSTPLKKMLSEFNDDYKTLRSFIESPPPNLFKNC